MINRSRPNFIGVWLSDFGHTALREWITKADLSQSEAVRQLLAHGVSTLDPAKFRSETAENSPKNASKQP